MDVPRRTKSLIRESQQIHKRAEDEHRRSVELIKNLNAICLRTLALVG